MLKEVHFVVRKPVLAGFLSFYKMIYKNMSSFYKVMFLKFNMIS